MSPPPETAVIRELAGSHGVGPAGISAALALGLTTQVPRRTTVAVVGSPPRDLPALHFVGRPSALKRTGLRPAEIALFEVLREWDDVVEVELTEAVDHLAGLVADGSLRANRLVKAAATEPAGVQAGLRGLLAGADRLEDASAIPVTVTAHHPLAN